MTLRRFMDKVGRDGIALQSKYRVDFMLPPILLTENNSATTDDLSLYCNMATMPRTTLLTSNVKTYGPARQYAYARSAEESTPMLFYIDRNMQIKRFFDLWVEKIHSLKNFHLSYFDEYATEIKITQLDHQGTDVYSIVLVGAFPKMVNDLQLSADTTQPHSLDVNFAYWYWTPVDVNGVRDDYFWNTFLGGMFNKYQLPFNKVEDIVQWGTDYASRKVTDKIRSLGVYQDLGKFIAPFNKF